MMLDFQTIVDTADEDAEGSFTQQAQAIRDQIKRAKNAPKAPAAPKTAKQIREEFRLKQQQAAEAAETLKDNVVAAAVQNCDLDCFSECLNLKSFAPYEVIETCVTQKCGCDIPTGVSNLLEGFQIEPETTSFFGSLWSFTWRLVFAVILGTIIFLTTRKVVRYLDQKVFTKERMDNFAMGSQMNDGLTEEDYKRIL